MSLVIDEIDRKLKNVFYCRKLYRTEKGIIDSEHEELNKIKREEYRRLNYFFLNDPSGYIIEKIIEGDDMVIFILHEQADGDDLFMFALQAQDDPQDHDSKIIDRPNLPIEQCSDYIIHEILSFERFCNPKVDLLHIKHKCVKLYRDRYEIEKSIYKLNNQIQRLIKVKQDLTVKEGEKPIKIDKKLPISGSSIKKLTYTLYRDTDSTHG